MFNFLRLLSRIATTAEFHNRFQENFGKYGVETVETVRFTIFDWQPADIVQMFMKKKKIRREVDTKIETETVHRLKLPASSIWHYKLLKVSKDEKDLRVHE